MSDKYILNEQGQPVPEMDVMTWATWFETADRKVKQDMVNGAKVSTVFLGLNHNFGRGKPILWETMIFGGPNDQYQDRCAGNREQAEAMHAKAVKLALSPAPKGAPLE